MDLLVWQKQQMPVRFQLSYNKGNDEHALCWDRERGFSHHRIDDSEVDVSENKMPPQLTTPINAPDLRQLAIRFLRASDNIEPLLADFIYARLLEYPQAHRPRANRHSLAAGR